VLVRLGHNVTILERSTPSSLLDQGAGINVAPYIPPIIASLNQLGIPSPIFEFFEEYDRTGKPWCISTDEATLQILRRDGGVKAAPSVKGMLLGSTSWELLYNILRANFDGKFENGFIDEAEEKGSDGNAKYLHGMQVNSLVDLGTEGVAIECDDRKSRHWRRWTKFDHEKLILAGNHKRYCWLRGMERYGDARSAINIHERVSLGSCVLLQSRQPSCSVSGKRRLLITRQENQF
jgi:hypothetical protein